MQPDAEASLAAPLGEEIRRVWPAAAALGPELRDVRTLFEFLSACNARLDADQRRLVLA